MTADERAQIVVTARLLSAAAPLQWLTLVLTAIAAFTFSHRIASTLAVLLGCVGTYFAVRVSFDARLFDDIAAERLSTAELDRALSALGRAAADRSWADRCRGARRLVTSLSAATIAQTAAVVWSRWS